MTGRTEIRVREIHRRTRRYRRRYENRALYSLTAFSLFLFSGIGFLLRKVQSGGLPTVADSYGSVLLQGGAGAYIVVGIAAFTAGVAMTALRRNALFPLLSIRVGRGEWAGGRRYSRHKGPVRTPPGA